MSVGRIAEMCEPFAAMLSVPIADFLNPRGQLWAFLFKKSKHDQDSTPHGDPKGPPWPDVVELLMSVHDHRE